MQERPSQMQHLANGLSINQHIHFALAYHLFLDCLYWTNLRAILPQNLGNLRTASLDLDFSSTSQLGPARKQTHCKRIITKSHTGGGQWRNKDTQNP